MKTKEATTHDSYYYGAIYSNHMQIKIKRVRQRCNRLAKSRGESIVFAAKHVRT